MAPPLDANGEAGHEQDRRVKENPTALPFANIWENAPDDLRDRSHNQYALAEIVSPSVRTCRKRQLGGRRRLT